MDTHTHTKKKGRAYIQRMFAFSVSPQKHFNTLIVVCLLAFIGIVFFHSYVLYRVEFFDTQETGKGDVVPIPTINETKLSSVLNTYAQKAKTQSVILMTSPNVIDPNR